VRYIILLAIAILLAPSAHADDLSAGVAIVDITPPVGYRMSGYFRERKNTGKHDALHAKALVFKQGDVHAALVFCDLIGISLEVSTQARRLAAKQTGIPAANILIAATHSHTGPLYFGALRKHFHDQAVKQHGSDPLERVDYPKQLAERLASAIEKAQAAARPITLSSGVAQETTLSFNRRFHMKDGTVRFNPGKLNPSIVRVAGPIDPEVGMIWLRDAKSEKPLAAISVFALHLDTVGGTLCSADYPLYLEKSLRETYGEKFVSLFGIGTCGDINHVDVSHKRPQKGQVEAKRIGTKLGETVVGGVKKLTPQARLSLAVRSKTVDVPLQQYSQAETAQALNDMAKIGTRQLSFLDQVRTYKITALKQRGGKTIPLEVQVFRFSDEVALVGLPGEVFVDLGLAIKRASPFKTTLVVELCNDAPGYIPTRKAFAEGSYEIVNSRIRTGGGEAMAGAAIKLLKQLHDVGLK
jgi:hypothetical protein